MTEWDDYLINGVMLGTFSEFIESPHMELAPSDPMEVQRLTSWKPGEVYKYRNHPMRFEISLVRTQVQYMRNESLDCQIPPSEKCLGSSYLLWWSKMLETCSSAVMSIMVLPLPNLYPSNSCWKLIYIFRLHSQFIVSQPHQTCIFAHIRE